MSNGSCVGDFDEDDAIWGEDGSDCTKKLQWVRDMFEGVAADNGAGSPVFIQDGSSCVFVPVRAYNRVTLGARNFVASDRGLDSDQSTKASVAKATKEASIVRADFNNGVVKGNPVTRKGADDLVDVFRELAGGDTINERVVVRT